MAYFAALDSELHLPDLVRPVLAGDVAYLLSTITVESVALVTDASDSDAWARAMSKARTFGISRVLGTNPDYYFLDLVSLSGFSNLVIAGQSSSHTTIHAKTGSGAFESAFMLGPGDSAASNITFQDLAFDGGITNLVALGTGFARDERTFAADRFKTAIKIFGSLVPGVSGYPIASNVTIRNVEVTGTESLPVFISGIGGNVQMTGCTTTRTLDIGFTFCESVTFTGNHIFYSADNGVSLSRGNTRVVCTSNTTLGVERYGIWLGGFDASPGAGGGTIPATAGSQDLTVTGNVVVTSGYGGIYADGGPVNGSITGNMIRDVRRGPTENTDSLGVGISIGGFTPSGFSDANPFSLAQNLTIQGNTIVDARNGGISVLSSKNISVCQNLIIRPGMPFKVDGITVPTAVGGYFAFGISIPGAGQGTGVDAYVSNITISGNTVIDDRPTPAMQQGIFTGGIAGISPTNNTVFGSINAYVEVLPNPVFQDTVRIGRTAGTAATMFFDTGSARTTQTVHRRAGTNVQGQRVDGSNNFQHVVYPGGVATVALTIDPTLGQFSFAAAPKIPNFAEASLPSAATAGKGAMAYNATTSKPVYSDGAAWQPAQTFVDGGQRFIGRLDQKATPIRIGLAGDSTGDDLFTASGDHREWFYRGIQKIIDRYPLIECTYRTSYYDTTAYKSYSIVPIGFMNDLFAGSGELSGKAATTGQVWSGTAGSWAVSGAHAVASGSATATLTTATAQAGNGRRVSGVVVLDTTTPTAERSFSVDLGVDTNNRVTLKIAMSATGVAYAAVSKTIGGTTTSNIITKNPLSTAVTLGKTDTAIPFQIKVTPTQVSMYVGADSSGVTITSAEFTALGGLTMLAMRATISAGIVSVERIGLGDVQASPVLMDVYNGSKAGSTLADQTTDFTTLYPVSLDAMFISSSHNYGTDDEPTYTALVQAFIDGAQAALPSAGFVLVGQNPEFAPASFGSRQAHNQRLVSLRVMASAHGYGYIPIAERWYSQSDQGASLIYTDGVHPIPAGSELGGVVLDQWATKLSIT